MPGHRYQIRAEIGRGGFGRVVEATDRVLARNVALKLLLPEAPLEAVMRFRREGLITAVLEHPGIVPIHDAGTLPEDGGLYYAMKRISGTDLSDAIHRDRLPLRRLVQAFRDACLAVAFAHGRGAVHRDLKPANVMLGEEGEVLVLDWGLAKIEGLGFGAQGPAGAGRSPGPEPRPLSPALTLDGDVFGTPSYMPPEQAAGRTDEVDARSDVYGLGAILYEILTGRPPVEGRTTDEILTRVVSGQVKAPSTRLAELSRTRPAAPIEAVPPELEAACMRALSGRREDRQADAVELARDADRFLAGAFERDRRARIVAAEAEHGREAADRWRAKAEEARATRERAVAAGRSVPRAPGVEDLVPAWELSDAAEALQAESLRAFAEADAAFASALSYAPAHPVARAGRAALHWKRFLEAEEAEEEEGQFLHRRMAETHDDGALTAALRGESALSLRTAAYACGCLREGREVAPGELGDMGFHPWSGRRLDGTPSEGAPELEPAAPLHLRVHGRACRPQALEGARVWAFAMEEEERLLVPVTPGACTEPVPPAVLDSLFGDSLFRPRGGGLFLGRTPIGALPLRMGSWLLVIERAGSEPRVAPVFLERGRTREVELVLFAPGEGPEGFRVVGGPPFRWHWAQRHEPVRPARTRRIHEHFVARLPVTCAEYANFLNDPGARDRAAAGRRAPRNRANGETCWPEGPAGWIVPTAGALPTLPPELAAGARRLSAADRDWEDAWPVLGVSWRDAVAYAEWRSRREGRLYTIPDEHVYENAACGADGRDLPWGNCPSGAFCVGNLTFENSMHPAPVGQFPTDESVWGIRDLGGNAETACLNTPRQDLPGLRAVRGGRWSAAPEDQGAIMRQGFPPDRAMTNLGIRLVAPVRLEDREEDLTGR